MKKYEYKLHTIDQMKDQRDMEIILNELGNQGWSIADWQPSKNPRLEFQSYLILQREK